MYWFQITKYNPKYRNELGHYLKDEWTDFSDIGKKHANDILTYDEYIEVENAYVKAILNFMNCLNLDSVRVSGLEKRKLLENSENYSKSMIEIYKKIKDKQFLDRQLLDQVIRLILRTDLWCKLQSKDLEVHFGYDYYMYIGSSKPCEEIIPTIEKMGLFVEAIKDSPYNIE